MLAEAAAPLSGPVPNPRPPGFVAEQSPPGASGGASAGVTLDAAAIAARLDAALSTAEARRLLELSGASATPGQSPSDPPPPDPTSDTDAQNDPVEQAATDTASVPRSVSESAVPDPSAGDRTPQPPSMTDQPAPAMDAAGARRLRCLADRPMPEAREVILGAMPGEQSATPALPPADALADALGPEAVAALESGAAAASRLTFSSPTLAGRVDLQRLFGDLLVPCSLIRATAGMLAAARRSAGDHMGPEARSAALDALAAHPAWEAFQTGFLAVPEALRSVLALRLGQVLVLEGTPAPLLLIEPHLGLADRSPARRLIDAHVALVRGEREAAVAAFSTLARRDDTVGQIATVLLGEELDPAGDMPIPTGWLAHIDLLGSIATEHAGAPFASRAALAEVRLTMDVLGPAAALRALSLAHRRGSLDSGELEDTARRLWAAAPPGAEAAGEVDLGLWAAVDRAGFSTVLEHLPASVATGPGAPAVEAPSPSSTPSDSRRGTALPGWRGLVSDQGSVSPDARAEADGRAEPNPVPEANSPETTEPSTAEQPAAADPAPAVAAIGAVPGAPPADVLAEIERVLADTQADLETIRRTLDDG
ncbi:MAG: hypothetical protein AAFS07_09045 [Pseudomonadota bacterium]